ncbi:IS256 family transposase, partial [Paenibacillus macerans]
YLDVIAYNERFENRVIRGFGDPTVKLALARLFDERYSDSDSVH